MSQLTTPTPARHSRGYSLEESSRIRRAILHSTEAGSCPSCGAALQAITGADGTSTLWLVRCRACGRSLVVRDAAEAGAGA
jgi:transcription elongation factor Elf1